MLLLNVLPVLFRPGPGWEAIKGNRYGSSSAFFGHTVLLALIPPVCGYIGTTRSGWNLGLERTVRMTAESAAQISSAYYLALLMATVSVAWAAHWMSRTYGSNASFADALVLATVTATPLFLIGFAQLSPELWLNLLLGLPALAWTVMLFFSGVPVMLEVSTERGFLLACAVMAFGLVTLVAMLGISVLLWSYGFTPEFTS